MLASRKLTASQACMSECLSCSACCGLFNYRGSDDERRAWVLENTRQFLELDLSTAANIVRYRKEREAVTLPNRVRDDIYVCPFLGFVDTQNLKTGSRTERPRVALEPSASMRTGCLLHPQGSPHPQISLWPHPQNFSFYGEGICLSYDCLAKDRQAYREDFFAWAETASLFAYGRLASDHTLHRALGLIARADMKLEPFYNAVADLYQRHGVVTTSFEDIEKSLPETPEELCRLLARRADAQNEDTLSLQLMSVFPR